MIAIELYRAARIGCFSSGLCMKEKSKKEQVCFPPNVFKTELLLFFVQTCIIFIYLITLKFNINMSFLKWREILIFRGSRSSEMHSPAFQNGTVLGNRKRKNGKISENRILFRPESEHYREVGHSPD